MSGNSVDKINEERLWKLRLVLDETVEFPTEYLFKFIVPMTELPAVLKILEGLEIEERASTGGKYISVSAKKVFQGSDEIIKIYRSANGIKGIISL